MRVLAGVFLEQRRVRPRLCDTALKSRVKTSVCLSYPKQEDRERRWGRRVGTRLWARDSCSSNATDAAAAAPRVLYTEHALVPLGAGDGLCAPAAAAVVNATECAAAATELEMTFAAAVTDTALPRGCVYVEATGDVYWNNPGESAVAAGAVRDPALSRICRSNATEAKRCAQDRMVQCEPEELQLLFPHVLADDAASVSGAAAGAAGDPSGGVLRGKGVLYSANATEPPYIANSESHWQRGHTVQVELLSAASTYEAELEHLQFLQVNGWVDPYTDYVQVLMYTWHQQLETLTLC